MDTQQEQETVKTNQRTIFTPQELRANLNDCSWINTNCFPNCVKCHGSGSYMVKLENGEERYTTCHNTLYKQALNNSKVYGLSPYELNGLEWSVVKDIGNAWKAMEAVRRILLTGYGWLFLWGDHGQAKTLLLKIAIAEVIRYGTESAYTSMVGMMDNFKKAFGLRSGDSPDAESRIEFWQQIPVLAIDEFNRVKESDWVDERRFALMDTRYTQAIQHESITLIASNTSPEQQDSYLRDRILDGRFEVIELKGPSVRKSIHDKDFIF